MRLLIVPVVFVLASISAYADIINGGFELGNLTGWTPAGNFNSGLGNVQVLASGQFASNSGPSVTVSAPQGSFYALLSNGPGGTPGGMSTLTSVPYVVGPGADISFLLDFFTNEFSTAMGGSPDFFDVFVLPQAGPTATLASGDVDGAQQSTGVDCISAFLVTPDGNTTVCTDSGYVKNGNSSLLTFNKLPLNAYAGQIVQFQFLVSDPPTDAAFDSALLVDGVHGDGLTPFVPGAVPEPRSWILLLTAVGLPYVYLRRWRNR
jgi:hypothetical protein